MVKTLRKTKLSETTSSYMVQVEISDEKSYAQYLEEFREQRDRVEPVKSAQVAHSATGSEPG